MTAFGWLAAVSYRGLIHPGPEEFGRACISRVMSVVTWLGAKVLSRMPVRAFSQVSALVIMWTAAFLAMRWSGRRTAAAGMPAGMGMEDPQMSARLNDELRNLD